MPTRRATALQSGFTHSAPKPSSSLELAGSLLRGKHTQFSSSHFQNFLPYFHTSPWQGRTVHAKNQPATQVSLTRHIRATRGMMLPVCRLK